MPENPSTPEPGTHHSPEVRTRPSYIETWKTLQEQIGAQPGEVLQLYTASLSMEEIAELIQMHRAVNAAAGEFYENNVMPDQWLSLRSLADAYSLTDNQSEPEARLSRLRTAIGKTSAQEDIFSSSYRFYEQLLTRIEREG